MINLGYIFFYFNNNYCIYLFFKEKSFTLSDLKISQIFINKIYLHAELMKRKYILFFNINNFDKNLIKNISYIDFVNLYTNNIKFTEKFVKKIFIISNNFWQKSFLNIFFIIFKLNIPLKFLDLKENNI